MLLMGINRGFCRVRSWAGGGLSDVGKFKCQSGPAARDPLRPVGSVNISLAMDHATPNLPSRDFQATSDFYRALGFEEGWRDEGWMILKRGELTLEFFPHPELDPSQSWFSCCLRLDDLASFYRSCVSVGLPETCWGYPRLHPPAEEDSGLTIAALIDADGSLVRLIQN